MNFYWGIKRLSRTINTLQGKVTYAGSNVCILNICKKADVSIGDTVKVLWGKKAPNQGTVEKIVKNKWAKDSASDVQLFIHCEDESFWTAGHNCINLQGVEEYADNESKEYLKSQCKISGTFWYLDENECLCSETPSFSNHCYTIHELYMHENGIITVLFSNDAAREIMYEVIQFNTLKIENNAIVHKYFKNMTEAFTYYKNLIK